MNYYLLLNCFYNADILTICESFKNSCITHPENTFLYTKAFNILINKNKRLFYDSLLFSKDITYLYNNIDYNFYYDIDEYELIPFIEWLEDYQNFFYDTKYYSNNTKYHQAIENWFNTIEQILEHLKSLTESFYLI